MKREHAKMRKKLNNILKKSPCHDELNNHTPYLLQCKTLLLSEDKIAIQHLIKESKPTNAN